MVPAPQTAQFTGGFFVVRADLSYTATSTQRNMATKKTTSKKKPDYNKLALMLHKKLHGKLETSVKGALKTKTDWSTMYTPGVAAVCSAIAKKPATARDYTIKRNTVAVISDGSAVLGLGNLGGVASLPVMEGKCAIFKELADVDAFPIVLDTQDTDEIIAAVKAIAPTFGGINLEDISAPKCFEIEEALIKDLSIPVMHDDQHGTAIVVLAALINASKVVKKQTKSLKVVIVGAGAAGKATAELLVSFGIANVIVLDSMGAIHVGRGGLSEYKEDLAKVTNPERLSGDLLALSKDADVLIGLSGPGSIARVHIEEMANNPIVFAMANPIPEIMPVDAKRAGAAVIATGRSDLPNQVNNALVFPGIFRGVLDKGVQTITTDMKLAAAKKIAAMIKKPTADCIIPSVTTPGLSKKVASAITRP